MPQVNDFTLKIATVNGTGSASANGLLMKSIFRMGVPVMGKNYFPSNIQGLPTWYEIRVTDPGHLTRAGQVHFMVAMNAETFAKDQAEIAPGGYLFYDSTWPRTREITRDDITVIGVPLAEMINHHFVEPRTRILMKNVAYVGALAALLDLDLDIIEQLLKETFGEKKAKLVEPNMEAVHIGYDYAKKHYDCPLPLHVKKADMTKGHVIVDGNTTAALGAMLAGANVAAWYPITPSTSVMDAFTSFCAKHRHDDQGQPQYKIIQAEDELAACGMVLGAGWMGARAFTATSGPGISLMNEFISFGYYTEIPAVIFDIQRVGPSTGMPTRTQQSDINECAYAGHGDTRHICLYPADPREAFDFAIRSFDLAEHFQTPVFVVSDLDIGMNEWMVPELKWNESYRPDRGKVLSAGDLDKLEGRFGRYQDPDRDGIPWRTLPGVHPKGAYFTRGSGHSEHGTYTEDAAEYQRVLDRLRRKFDTARKFVPAPYIDYARSKPVKAGIISLGSCDLAVKEARHNLKGKGTEFDYCRIRAFPFTDDIRQFIDEHETVFVIEQNRDAQLKAMLQAELDADARKLVPILHYNGLPIASMHIEAAIEDHFREAEAS
ncbi:2-oxoacid:acceptor oxidoreductase subunit alpha [Natronospira bacteriovora]|uniref:2-oxoacid:acceptor oxidoreductase subunit alpha n=1 Tax=Natronospira bacteriovora TaxID=3069753 RepID=A0ABU0W3S3_9GAMM|nr:2-oxoacid:acceptor oxidoreductase subunit alpha [Natronospira sp. AB-CW4]MDQ2068658.1 2-oxoacid:acceptor oxidoreductase subunit alpha [Natronospira sp. AB-CW4]